MRAQGQGWGMGEREPFDTGEGGTPADHTAAEPPAPAPDTPPPSAARGAALSPGAASPPGSPSLPRAADDRRTAAALHAYRRRARHLLLAGPGLGALGVALAMAGGIAERVVFLAFVLCVTATGIGIGSLLVGRRMAAALAAGPWQVCEARSAPSGLHAAAAILRDPATGGLLPLRVVAIRQRYHLADPGPAGVLRWCGDPLRGGVLAPPGHDALIWAKPVRGERQRRSLVRMAESQGLSSGPASAPASVPASAPASGVPGGHGSRDGAPESGGDLPGRPGRARRRGLFRWVLLVGAVCTGLALAWSGTPDDPQVELTVVQEQPDGRCRVAWTDPFDGTARTGDFSCDADRDPLLANWDVGYAVSSGPWKGELYAPGADRPGAAATDATGMTGLALLLLGVAGGVARRVVARVRAPRPGADRDAGGAGPTPVGRAEPSEGPAPGTGYAAFAAEARRQAPSPPAGRGRAEADVRRVAWWRVRTLRSLSQLPQVLLGAGLACGAAVVLGTSAEVSPMAVLVAASGTLYALYSAYRALTWGVPAARRLALTARSGVPGERRYALVHSPGQGAPVLVLFPARPPAGTGTGDPADGAGDPPEAVLALLFPVSGTPAQGGPPVEPVGTLELRLRQDGGVRTAAVWIEGRAYWPAHPYEELRHGDPEDRDLLTGLLAGARVSAGPR
ncbi:hypothetical protein [Streptomyces sp. C10-9-1]|uniref:hypothetical protein n=1 Tax=Streptomyces sp. C10-9-1 TaxID=1859285 RepID=UPI003D7320B7